LAHIFLVALFLLGWRNIYAEASSELHPKTDTERAVAALIRRGQTDIVLVQHGRKDHAVGEKPPRPVLSGSFVTELLLLRANAVPGRLIRIFGFTIKGEVTMTPDHDPVPFSVSFYSCDFTDKVALAGEFDRNVDFSYVRLTRGLSLDNVHIKGDLTFSEVSKANVPDFVEINMRKTIVDGTVVFDGFDKPAPESINGDGLTARSLFFFPAPQTVPSIVFSRLRTDDAVFSCDANCAPIEFLNIEGATIKENLRFTNFGMKNLHAQGLSVGNRTQIDGSSPIASKLDLTQASLGTFHWEVAERNTRNGQGKTKGVAPSWPETMTINGIDFSNLSVVPEQHPRKDARRSAVSNRDLNDQKQALSLEFLKQGDFYQPAFVAYQRSLESSGFDGAANDVNSEMHAKLRHLCCARYYVAQWFRLGI
jgi:hypothetical protein